MPNPEPLVSIGLPVRNAGGRVAEVVTSVLAQDYDRIEFVISDNASTDNTEDVCRELARGDSRIVYHRHPQNIGLFPNFLFTIALASGTFYRWIGDDDRLEPSFVARCLARFDADPRLLLVTTGIEYTGVDGATATAPYDSTALASDDPVCRFTEMLRLLNESYLLIDPLYGLMVRDRVVTIPRRNMLKEDEVFATKLALAGPWGHVPDVLAHRTWKQERLPTVARRLDVPVWRSHVANALECREILRWLPDAGLTAEQLTMARSATWRMYRRRHQRIIARRTGKLIRIATGR